MREETDAWLAPMLEANGDRDLRPLWRQASMPVAEAGDNPALNWLDDTQPGIAVPGPEQHHHPSHGGRLVSSSTWIVHLVDGRVAEVAADDIRVDAGALVLEPVVAFAPRTWTMAYRDSAQILWAGVAQPVPVTPTRTPRFA
jgi:hypothetical protein